MAVACFATGFFAGCSDVCKVCFFLLCSEGQFARVYGTAKVIRKMERKPAEGREMGEYGGFCRQRFIDM